MAKIEFGNTFRAFTGVFPALALINGGLPGLCWHRFLVLLTKCRSNSESLLCGLFFSFGYHLLALRFYAGAHLHMPLLIWFVQVALLSLPTVVFAWLINALPLRPGYIPYLQRPFFPYLISVPLLWIFLHQGLAIANPFAAIWQLAPLPPIAIDALVYSQYNQLAIIQSCKFIGSFGVEFFTIACQCFNSLFSFGIRQSSGSCSRKGRYDIAASWRGYGFKYCRCISWVALALWHNRGYASKFNC